MPNKIFKTFLLFFVTLSFAMGRDAGEGWYEFDRGISVAAEESKPVLIDFYTEWCHWCKVLDEKTFADETVKDYMDENFIRIKVHAEETDDEQTYLGKTYNSAELAGAFRVTGYPALAFLDKDQNLVTLVPGFLPPDKFINVLKYMKEECYTKEISFEEYIENGCEDSTENNS